MAAISMGIKSLFSKILLNKEHVNIFMFWDQLLGVLLLIPIVAYSGQFSLEQLTKHWYFLAIVTIPGYLGAYLYLKALKKGEVSSVVALSNVTPLLVVLTAPFINGEVVTMLGLAGIIVIIVGLWFMNYKPTENNFMNFRAMLTSSIFLMVMASCFFYAVSSNFTKNVLVYFPAEILIMYILIIRCVIGLPNTLSLFKEEKMRIISRFSKNKGLYLIASALAVAVNVAVTKAIELGGIVSYVGSIKRSGVIVAALLGYLILKEKISKYQWFGILTMTLGAILISNGM